jgi:hypothetical protein
MGHILLGFGLRQFLWDRSAFTTWCLYKETLDGFIFRRSHTKGIILHPRCVNRQLTYLKKHPDLFNYHPLVARQMGISKFDHCTEIIP